MTDDDAELFRRALADAKPIRSDNRVMRPSPKPPPQARFSRADDLAVLSESLLADGSADDTDNGDALRFHRPAVSRRTMRRLARGRFSVQAEIDLHGMTVAEAKPRLAEFINDCARKSRLCVRIVHGKGLGSGQHGPVLKYRVGRWLRQWDTVLAYVSARQVDGGTGALYVLLKSG